MASAVSAQPDRLPPGTEHVVVDVLAGSVDAAPAQLFKIATDPKAAEEMPPPVAAP